MYFDSKGHDYQPWIKDKMYTIKLKLSLVGYWLHFNLRKCDCHPWIKRNGNNRMKELQLL